MKRIDNILQSWRVRVAQRWVYPGARVLDIGCHQGELFSSLGDRIGPSVGYDPLVIAGGCARHRLVPEAFCEPMPFSPGAFDVIAMLATLEHIRDKEPLARESVRLLRPGGRLIITVPSVEVDKIVSLLSRLRLADGMSLEEHHGFDPRTTPAIFQAHGLVLEKWRRFQAGLNNLFVFRKP